MMPTCSTSAAEGQYPESITSKSSSAAFLRPDQSSATSSGVDFRPLNRRYPTWLPIAASWHQFTAIWACLRALTVVHRMYRGDFAAERLHAESCHGVADIAASFSNSFWCHSIPHLPRRDLGQQSACITPSLVEKHPHDWQSPGRESPAPLPHRLPSLVMQTAVCKSFRV